LVETKLASSVSTMDIAGHDPGMVLAFSEVPLDGDLEKVRTILLEKMEKVGQDGVDSAMVKRAIQRLESQRERQFANTSRFAINLSEWRAYGDWRLYFLHRDRIEKVTAADVKRVAAEYLIQSNRTVGMFIPTESPVRAPLKSSPKLSEVLAGYKGRQAISRGEAFEATTGNIDKRTEIGELDSGIKYALLPKKTRGERVFLTVRLQYGDEENLKGLIPASELLPDMLGRGTDKMSFSEFRDRLDELNASMRFGGSAGVLTVSIQTKKEELPSVLDLMQDALRHPALDPKELDVIKRETITRLESMKSDPQQLAFNGLRRKLSPYPSENVRYVPSIEEEITRTESVSIQQIEKLQSQYLNGQHGELAIVGDFDPASSLEKLQQIFSDWKTDEKVARIASPATASPGERVDINTPDKKNAVYAAGISLPLREDNPDYESLLIGNYILGGGPLSSRLADRVRKKDGLSYGVGSMLNAHPIDQSGVFIMQAISNPENTPKVVAAINEEVQRLLESGVTADELERAKNSYLQNRQGGRAQDQQLVGMLINNLRTDRTMKFQQESDERIADLSKEDVDRAIRKYVEPEKLIIITAGDFNAASKDQEDGD
ncbi:MAG: insulinase family protein, partial [Planctomycetota bacterium]|nr:insulinase family protein [Planctomycetota bacterium]